MRSPRRPSAIAHRVPTGRAFTLVELLVVILILAIVIAILLPAMAGARRGAKQAATGAMLSGMAAAAGQFSTDKAGQTPGYFSPADMGSAENVNRGFCGMQNVLLDLSGGVTSSTATGAGIITVGPRAAGTVKVDIAQIGATSTGGTKAYFNPDRNYLSGPERPTGQVANVPDNLQVPHLIDSFGQPILAWTQDDRPPTNFGALDSSGEPARFYWASNAGILKSLTLGKLLTAQAFVAAESPYSMIGDGIAPAQLSASLEGLLGNAAYPAKNYSAANRKADKARASIVFHTAGPDGYFMGSEDRGGKIARGLGNMVLYTTDTGGAMSDFDDLVISAGN